MSTAFRQGAAETACRVGVLCADSMNTCMSASIGSLESASFSERVLPVSGFLSLPFLTRFPHITCHIQGQGFGNKMYISELFTVVGYLHTAGFKNHRGINFAKCRCKKKKCLNLWTVNTQQIHIQIPPIDWLCRSLIT